MAYHLFPQPLHFIQHPREPLRLVHGFCDSWSRPGVGLMAVALACYVLSVDRVKRRPALSTLGPLLASLPRRLQTRRSTTFIVSTKTGSFSPLPLSGVRFWLELAPALERRTATQNRPRCRRHLQRFVIVVPHLCHSALDLCSGRFAVQPYSSLFMTVSPSKPVTGG